MNLLLDSHILLWWDSDLTQLSSQQRQAISSPANQVFVSSATVWELGIKQSSGKLSLHAAPRMLIQRLGFSELTITSLHAEHAANLPPIHKDPFDRMLIAQAIAEGMVLLTSDPMISEYNLALLV